MPAKVDKNRPEQLGKRSFTGSGVDTIPDIMEEQVDLRQQIQDMINESLSSITGGTTVGAAPQPDQITYQFSGGGISHTQLNNAVTVLQDFLLDTMLDLRSEIIGRMLRTNSQITNLQRQINDLKSGTGGGVKVFRYDSRTATAGQYNCVELEWGLSAGVPVWLEPFSKLRICKNILEAVGWIYYESTAFFMSVGNPVGISNGDDIFPVMPLRGVIQKAYVKTTPGATTTLVCYLSKDINGSPTPTEINVSCVIDGGGDLNAAVPSVVDGDYIWVQNVLGTWVNVTPFFAAEACP